MDRYVGTIESPFSEELIEMVYLTISENLIEIEFNSSLRTTSNVSVIKGVFSGLGTVTFLNCSVSGTSLGSGADLIKYSSEYMFKGIHFNEINELSLDRVYVEMIGLHRWIKLPNINNDLYSNNALTIEGVEDIEIFQNDEFSLEFCPYYSQHLRREDNSTTIITKVSLRIKSKIEIDFWKYLNLIDEVKKIIHLLSNESTKSDSITFYTDDNVEVKLFSEDNNSISGNSFTNSSLKFSEITNLHSLFDNWFKNRNIQTSIDLILEKSKNNKLSRENYFLNNCFAIETFHRRFKNFKLYKPSEFRDIKKQILINIEKSEIRSTIENSLAHLNEPNFRRRLLDFKDDFDSILLKEIMSEEYITKIVKTRNSLVHRSSDKNTFDDFDLLYSAIFLENLVKINILRLIGVEDELLEKYNSNIQGRVEGLYYANKKREFDK